MKQILPNEPNKRPSPTKKNNLFGPPIRQTLRLLSHSKAPSKLMGTLRVPKTPSTASDQALAGLESRAASTRPAQPPPLCPLEPGDIAWTGSPLTDEFGVGEIPTATLDYLGAKERFETGGAWASVCYLDGGQLQPLEVEATGTVWIGKETKRLVEDLAVVDDPSVRVIEYLQQSCLGCGVALYGGAQKQWCSGRCRKRPKEGGLANNSRLSGTL